jgi:hypothetical protein
VMASLNTSSNWHSPRAQVTGDDKELKALVKEIESETPRGDSGTSGGSNGLPRGRRPKPKVPAPPHAPMQRPILMEVEDRWEKGYKNAFASAHKPWIFNNQKSPSFGTDYLTKRTDDGWEV